MSEIDKTLMIKQITVSVGRGMGAGFIRMGLALGFAFVINLSCGIGFIMINPVVVGRGHGSWALIAIFVAPPFLLGMLVIGFLAYKQALQGIFARAIESQANNIAQLGGYLLELFLQKINYQSGSQLDENFLPQWNKFLQGQTDLPKPLPFILKQLTNRLPLISIIANVAKPDMSLSEIANATATHLIKSVAEEKLSPSASTLIITLLIEIGCWILYIVWFESLFTTSI